MSLTVDDIEPLDIRWTDQGHMMIAWSDGQESTYSPALLRSVCPCAECQGTHGGPPKAFRILSPDQVRGAARQIVVTGVEPMGHYALCFHWGDGHKDGIYTWPYLRQQCPSEAPQPPEPDAS